MTYTNVTAGGMLRHGILKGLRFDLETPRKAQPNGRGRLGYLKADNITAQMRDDIVMPW